MSKAALYLEDEVLSTSAVADATSQIDCLKEEVSPMSRANKQIWTRVQTRQASFEPQVHTIRNAQYTHYHGHGT